MKRRPYYALGRGISCGPASDVELRAGLAAEVVCGRAIEMLDSFEMHHPRGLTVPAQWRVRTRHKIRINASDARSNYMSETFHKWDGSLAPRGELCILVGQR